MKFWLLLLLMGVGLCLPIFAQTPSNNNIWISLNEQPSFSNTSFQVESGLVYQLNIQELTPLLATALSQHDTRNGEPGPEFSLPMPDGSFQRFNIVHSPVMHPDLASRYPAIQCYAGIGMDDPTAHLRFDVTPSGFHALVLSGNGEAVLIDPIGESQPGHYIVYHKKDALENEPLHCSVADDRPHEAVANDGDRSSNCTLRTYRLALACTGEYAAFHGGTVENALAAMVTTMNRVNAIFERDASVRLQLVANNDLLIFTDALQDPYHNYSGSKMLEENQQVCDEIIGAANYDIGHVFSTGGGGIAYVKSACHPSIKAGGVSGKSVPIGSAFDIDYVCHEIGHQFGANHTQNNNCNRNPATSVEPGSGSTIMGYAGLCYPNMQSNSDAYFHGISLAEMASHIGGAGGDCAVHEVVNDAPSPLAVPNYAIPKSTYFFLEGTASDPNGDEGLTYCWEQMDNEVAVMPPVSQNTAGPLFRSFPPSIEGRRYFPNLEDIVNNRTSEWEVLPAVGRELKFRLTIRDNHPGAGCVSGKDMTLNVDGDAGPFLVTSPNEPIEWEGGSQQNIAWEVANTHTGLVNCGKVDILLSLDGGHTYPFVLASGAANDGSHNITVPNEPSDQARIMVKGTNHIFFDISDNNLRILPTSQFFVSITKKNIACFGDSTGYAKANASGGIGNYSYQWSTGATTAQIKNLSPGIYRVTVTSGSKSTSAAVTISQPNPLKVNVMGTNGPNGSVTANVTGGTGAYTYLWSNGKTAATLENLLPGAYYVTVSDANQCTAIGSIALQGQSSTDPDNPAETTSKPDPARHIAVFPNPVSNAATIEFYQTLSGGPTVLLFDMFGRLRLEETLLTSEPGLRQTVLDMADFEAGCYALHIVEGNRRKVVKVVKTNGEN